MTTLMGCIADDFTGATDLAGLLARSGVRVSLRIGVPSEAPSDDTAPFEVIALKCRTAPLDDAIAETKAALAWLQQTGAQRFFWKYCSTFDSTPQGNIGPVAEALMAELNTTQTIYCPAFPENGRSIFMGNLYVGEQPLAESPMKDHPLTPMRDSNLLRLLQPQVTRPVGMANRLTVAKGTQALQQRLQDLAAEGVAHVVVDAVANEDLYTISDACKDMPLMTGSSAVAMSLPKIWQRDGLLKASTNSDQRSLPAERTVILSGSCSAMSNRQVAAYTTHAPGLRLDPLELAEQGHEPALAWLKQQAPDTTPIVYATADPESVAKAQRALGVAQAGEIVEQALAKIAVAAREMGARRFIVAGGESSGAVTQALGVSQLDIGAEIAPGVPWCFAQSAGNAIAITLKSGNFGAPSFFDDALKALEQA